MIFNDVISKVGVVALGVGGGGLGGGGWGVGGGGAGGSLIGKSFRVGSFRSFARAVWLQGRIRPQQRGVPFPSTPLLPRTF